MVVLKKRKLFLKLEEVYYAQDYTSYMTDADIILFYQSVKSYEPCKLKNTLHIDLSKDEDTLYSEIHDHTKRELTKARNYNLKYIFNENPTMEELKKFSEFYNSFAKTKEIAEIDPESYRSLLDKKSFIITQMLDESGNTCCYHTYIIDGYRARAQHSCSQFRNTDDREYRYLVGRANRMLHWKDILEFKKKGYSIYDFGGLALKDDPVLANIDRFKKSFGGTIVQEYEFYQPRTLLGKILLSIIKKEVS
ncbi:peptidoglycan bridge formation glycyltransferase FemA/FemB family protein [Pseudobacteroides cellulosolvens]|uniref:Methicillin resistance protein n=1 Tax=Pseudobacteroides cellulosolvens ATCC 35603 = DSM 2933 TaxID=398512 RepID=A0A0L6JLG0_9FIRM|nr:peptidoglycan bridge formation glycyltransferase FemA/FemB family protein [Pseudobacteroides cellulosolvens]KNY26595.1 Methicillin resistance protein [Pseudobacteroides cellulosolvens ATCC 35603 = DSM 2933]